MQIILLQAFTMRNVWESETCQNLILFNQNHFKRGVRYCFEFNFPQEGKRSGLPLPSYIIFLHLRQYSLEKITRLHREIYKLGYRLGKNAMMKLFFFNLKITSLNRGDKYLSIKLRREKKRINIYGVILFGGLKGVVGLLGCSEGADQDSIWRLSIDHCMVSFHLPEVQPDF